MNQDLRDLEIRLYKSIGHGETPMLRLLRELYAATTAKGYTLSRWQSNKGGHRTLITWAIHEGERGKSFEEVKARGDALAWGRLFTAEGTTEKSAGYRVLHDLLTFAQTASGMDKLDK